MLVITQDETLTLMHQRNASSIGPRIRAAALANQHCELGDQWSWSNRVIKQTVDGLHRLMCVRHVLSVAFNTLALVECAPHRSENCCCSGFKSAL